ncbi:MAG: hypothetical protein P4M05_32450 [Bradyrhizobium sp.]|nr:hypothetical protein [Bradyrhizobium sp.]
MSLITAEIIAPDSSHWANWIDGALSADRTRRDKANGFHQRLLDLGKIPFLSWHHLEELLGIEDEGNARARIAFLQSLPLIAWMRFPQEPAGLGAITDILAAEAIAVNAGCDSPRTLRDHVRQLLMRTGPAAEAIGTENWVWEVVRPEIFARRSHVGMVAALSSFNTFDESQTVGQVATQAKRRPEDVARKMRAIHAQALSEAMAADKRRTPAEARAMADEFVSRVLAMMPTRDISVRELLVSTYVAQGLDPGEIRDESRISDLSTLATFRSQLRVVAERTNLSFDQLKRVRMEWLPSWRIVQALRKHGQQRTERPGSNVTDEHLAVLAAYSDIVYVDRRTHEDFRRVLQKEPDIALLIGTVAKAGRYCDLVAEPQGT